MGTVIDLAATAANIKRVREMGALLLDCRDTRNAVLRRGHYVMECVTAFPYEAEVLGKEIDNFINACERFHQLVATPETREQLEVMMDAAAKLRKTLPAMHRALTEADWEMRACAAVGFGTQVANFQRQSERLFLLT